MFVLVLSFHRSIVSSYVVVLLAAEKPARWERWLMRRTVRKVHDTCQT